MKGERRNLWLIVVATATAVVAVWVLHAVWLSPHRSDLATYGAFAVAVVTLVAGWIGLLWRTRSKNGATLEIPELDLLADKFAGTVREQWEEAANERKLLWPEPILVRWRAPSEAMAGPVAAAVGSTRFPPLPGLHPVQESFLQEGDVRGLYTVYGGLGSGRLIIAGSPGSGKSGAAVLLIVAALRHREQATDEDRPRVPVPVMFTLHGWSPRTQSVQDWLIRRLRQTYPLFSAKSGALKASALIRSGKIAVILDGLDEIPENLRTLALRALSEQAAFRLLLLTRSSEMAVAAQNELLHGAAVVELQEIHPNDAADYLTRIRPDPPPRRWRELLDQLRRTPGSPLAQALSSPLALSLVRDTYRSEDDVSELLELSGTANLHATKNDRTNRIFDALLDRVLPAAYAPRPGNPAPVYDLPTAQNALRLIATKMKHGHTRDLAWWQIRTWVPATPRVLAVGTSFGVIFFLSFALIAGYFAGLLPGLVAMFITVARGRGLEEDFQQNLLLVRIRSMRGPERESGFARGVASMWRQELRLSVLIALMVGAAIGLINGITDSPWTGFITGLVSVPLLGLWVILLTSLSDPLTTPVPHLSPSVLWRRKQTHGLIAGIVVLALAIASGILVGGAPNTDGVSAVRLSIAVALFVFGIAAGFVVFCTPYLNISQTSLTFIQLTIGWRTPIRLMRFLEDARKRGVLRTVGPVYQFRHGRLQDRLAEQSPVD